MDHITLFIYGPVYTLYMCSSLNRLDEDLFTLFIIKPIFTVYFWKCLQYIYVDQFTPLIVAQFTIFMGVQNFILYI